MKIEYELKKLIFNVIDQAEVDLSLDDDLEKNLGYTSIDYIQLIVDIEDYFGIEFEYEDMEVYHTYGTLLEFIKRKMKSSL